MYYFASDYMEGAHPLILKKLEEINMEKISGYGCDPICAIAAEKIKEECECPKAEVHFLVGGTQANATVIGSALRPFEGVIAANTGHIAVHEAGAIEHGGREELSADIIESIENLEQKTKNNTGLQFTIAINYGGRDEITRAVRKLATAG